jgi:ribosomal protein L11
MAAIDPRYVAARRVLLDALEALSAHGQAVIVAGAQAVYLSTGEGEIGIAPYTTDADLAIDPATLRDEPQLETAMRAAHFTRSLTEPGIWLATTTVDGEELTIPVDLIVPEGVAPPGGRRGTRLGPHGNRAARRAVGLEAALVDHSTMTVTALEPADTRQFEVEVAGVAALLVAKAHKIHDRLASNRPGRAEDKDAADVYRLMQTTSPTDVAARLGTLRQHDAAGPVTEAAIGYLIELFGRRNSVGVQMAVRALQLAIPEEQVATLATGFINRLTAALEEADDA